MLPLCPTPTVLGVSRFKVRAACAALLLALAPLALTSADDVGRADASAPATSKVAIGPAVAIGGALRDDNAAVWTRIVDLAGAGPAAG